MIHEQFTQYRKSLLFLDSLPYPVIIHHNLAIVYVNRQGLEVIEHSRGKKIMGRNIFDFILPHFHEKVRARLNEHDRGMPFLSHTVETLVTFSGRRITLELTSSLIKLGWKKCIMVIGKPVTKSGKSAFHAGDWATTGRSSKSTGGRPLVSMCASCKGVKSAAGGWVPVELFVAAIAPLAFTHGICPRCAKSLYGLDIEE